MTHVMAKGANIALPAAAVRAVLRWSDLPGAPDVDASALLLGTNGRVRSDSDFVFYNQPRHPSGLVRHLPKQHTAGGTEITDTVEVELAKLPTTVDRVVLAGSSEGGPFRSVPGLFLLLFDVGAGEGAPPVAEFAIVDAENVTALVAGELYRRDGGWKFRAIGQGYTSGLIGLATDFGITVDDEERAAEPAPVTNNAPNSAPTGTPTAAVDPRATPVPAPRTTDPDTFRLPAANPPAAPQNTPAQNTPPQNTPASGPATPPPPTIAPPPPSAPPTMPPAAPPTPPPAPAPGGYGYPPAPAPGGYGYPPAPAPTNYGHPNSGGYGYPGPAQPYPPQPPATGYGQPNTGGYGYPPHGTGHQPPVQPPAQPPAPPATQPAEEFALPPQGPQFQPR